MSQVAVSEKCVPCCRGLSTTRLALAGGTMFMLCVTGMLAFGGMIEEHFRDFGVRLPELTQRVLALAHEVRASPVNLIGAIVVITAATFGAWTLSKRAPWIGLAYGLLSIIATIVMIVSVVWPEIMIIRAMK